MRVKILFFVLLGLFLVGSKNIFAQVNGNNVGPELPDPPAGQNVVCAKGFTGTAAVINNLNDAHPTNTAPCAHVVLRINVQAGDFGSSDITNFANQLNTSNDFNGGGPTVVVLGVEVSNLDQQGWNGARTSDVTTDLVTAASQYAQIFNQFSSAITNHSKYFIAPAPPDLYNSVYDPTVWTTVFANQVQCPLVDVLAADVFDVQPAAGVAAEGYTNLTTYQYLERHICSGKHVVHFEGWGAWPGDTIKNQIDFLKNQAFPSGSSVQTATSLIVNNCGGFGGNTGGNSNSVKPWLYWIPTTPDKVYNADGSEFNYSTCTGGGEAPRLFDLTQEVPCTDTTNPEFHSLRPYPANPCDKQLQDQTLLCSNDLVVVKSTSPGPGGTCTTPLADGSYDCTYKDVDEHVNVSVDLSGAELPIMGDTKDVPNATWVSSNTNATNFSAAQRVNNYVSWYLNGVINKAEEDFKVTEANPNYLVNYSGPLNKLLPFAVQTATRLTSVTNAIQTLANQKPANDQAARHNQIVGCPIPELFTQVPCYLFNSQNQNGLINLLSSIPGFNPSLTNIILEITTLIREDRLDTFANKQFQGFWSKVFPYIPYSTTEDRVGTAGTNPPPTTVPTNNEVTFTPSTGTNYEHNLYFAHMQEDAELANKLQSTFKSTFADSKTDQNKAPEIGAGCVIQPQNARTNPGDNLYGNIDRSVNAKGVPDTTITGTVNFKATYTCHWSAIRGAPVYSNGIIIAPPGQTVTCGKAIGSLSMFTQTPEAQNNWDTLVGGSQSIFKRFFPQVGANSPVTEIKETPAYTQATYNATDANGVAAGSQATAGEGGKNAHASVYFPYIGGIQDYFLQGIQAALRPQGMASGILASNPKQPNAVPPMCQLDGSGLNSQVLKGLVTDAAQWAHVPVQALVALVHGEACQGAGPLCTASDGDVTSWSVAGGKLPYNCVSSTHGGPLGFNELIWSTSKNAVNAVAGQSRVPDVCNIEDALYAAAYTLSGSFNGCFHPGYDVSNTPNAASWTLDNTKTALTAWSCGCTVVPSCQAAKNYYLSSPYINGGVNTTCNQ